jgi:peptidoglycan/LPS O-acetylase OafA/YrhL
MSSAVAEAITVARPRATGRSRLAYIDALRGVAAICVMYFHYALGMLGMPGVYDGIDRQIASALCEFVEFGKFGVALFFIISGFVIPSSLGLRGDIKNFMVSRFFRLYPMYWVTIAIAVSIAALSRTAFAPTTVLANITMLQGFAHIPDVVGVFWTLQIELIFYALCICLAFTGRIKHTNVLTLSSTTFLVCAVVMACVRYKYESKLPVALPIALFLMFLGALLRQALVENNQLAKRHVTRLLVAFLVALPAICVLAYNKDYGFHETWYQYFTSYSLAIVVFLSGTMLWKIENKVAVYFGKISYSIYLLHPVVAAGYYLVGVTPAVLHPDVIILLFSITTVLLATCTYKLIELPAIQIGKLVKRR